MTVGTQLTVRGKPWKIVNIDENETYLLKNEQNGGIQQKSRSELIDLYSEKKLRIACEDASKPQYDEKTGAAKRFQPTSLLHVSEKQRAEAMFRQALVLSTKEFVGKEKFVTSDITEDVTTELKIRFPEQEIPAPGTITYWARKYRKSGDNPVALIGRECLRGRIGSRIDKRTDHFIQEAGLPQYLSKQRKAAKVAFNVVRSQIARHNQQHNDDIPLPSRATFYRRLRALPSYNVERARHGRRIADKKFRMSGAGVEVSTILERVEIDHTPIDAFLIDDLTEKVIKRAILTLIIDVYSRAILGYAISIGGTPAWSVKRALYHAIMPKKYLDLKYPGKNWRWPCYGIGLQYWLDNGSEFHSESLRASLFDLGADVIFIPRRQPHMHGVIERFNQSINRGVSDLLPGRSFYKASERQDYESIKEACITISQFEELLHQWIIEVYHPRVHSTTGEPPIERWNHRAEIIPPLLPASAEALEFALSEFTTRTLSHKGVELHSIQYNSPELQEIRKRYGETIVVDVRYYPDDLTSVFVAPTGSKDFVLVQAVHHEQYVGLSLYEHKLRLKAKRKGSDMEEAHATARLVDTIDDMAAQTKLSQRTQKAKLEGERKAARNRKGLTQQQVAAAQAPKVLIDCEAN